MTALVPEAYLRQCWLQYFLFPPFLVSYFPRLVELYTPSQIIPKTGPENMKTFPEAERFMPQSRSTNVDFLDN